MFYFIFQFVVIHEKKLWEEQKAETEAEIWRTAPHLCSLYYLFYLFSYIIQNQLPKSVIVHTWLMPAHITH